MFLMEPLLVDCDGGGAGGTPCQLGDSPASGLVFKNCREFVETPNVVVYIPPVYMPLPDEHSGLVPSHML